MVVTREEALSMFEENKFKAEIIDGLPQDATISLYRCGPMVSPFCVCLACLLPVWCTFWPSQEVAQRVTNLWKNHVHHATEYNKGQEVAQRVTKPWENHVHRATHTVL